MTAEPDPKDLESMLEWVMTTSINEQESMDAFGRYLKKRPRENQNTSGGSGRMVVSMEEMFDSSGMPRRRRCPSPEEVRLQKKCEFVLETLLQKDEKKNLGLQVLRKICEFNPSPYCIGEERN